MSEEFGPDFITISDEDGNEFELELLDTLEHNGVTYYALCPADSGNGDAPDEDSEDYGMVILKVLESDGGNQILSTADTDEEAEEVYDLFMERIFSEDTEEENREDIQEG